MLTEAILKNFEFLNNQIAEEKKLLSIGKGSDIRLDELIKEWANLEKSAGYKISFTSVSAWSLENSTNLLILPKKKKSFSPRRWQSQMNALAQALDFTESIEEFADELNG